MKRITVILLLAGLTMMLASCAPKSFVKTHEPTWNSVELRDDITYDEAWNEVVDTLVKDFEMEVISKRDGYIRTNWLYTWTGEVNKDYKVRVTCKFSPDHEKLEMKSEAEYRGARGWTRGYDTQLLSTLKSDIMGKVGRATR